MPLIAHVVALAGAVSEVTLRAFKLTWSAKALDIPLTLGTAFRVCLGGDFGASVTPSRSGAEPARFLIMAEARTPLGGIVMVLWAEIVLEVLSLATVALLITGAVYGAVALIVKAGRAFDLPTVVEILDQADLRLYERRGRRLPADRRAELEEPGAPERAPHDELPVIHKRGNSLDTEAYLLWVERMMTAAENVILCERGIAS
ncbi:MAG: hypothetical protein HC937_03970, partial [Aquincola sp.]|nr:hypothetical protein [Aquincola sp.]